MAAHPPRTVNTPDGPRGMPAAAGSLANQVILVTGGGSGLGAATCRVLAVEGARVIVADRDVERARQTVADLEAAGSAAETLELDVGEAEAVERAIADIVARQGRIDVVINNAAIDVTAPLAELSVESWSRILQTNLTGPFLLSKYAAAAMRVQGRGQIVNIVSTAARRAWPNASAYHASKYGLLGLSHALHAELRDAGIKVSAVIAGGMRTPFLLERFPDLDPSRLQDPVNVAQAVRFVLTQPEGTVIPEVMVLPLTETSWP